MVSAPLTLLHCARYRLGQFGTGFLSDPDEVKAKMAAAALKYASFQHLVQPGAMASLAQALDGKPFPQELGPLGIAKCGMVEATSYDQGAASYTVDLQRASVLTSNTNLAALQRLGFDSCGKTGTVAPLPPGWTDSPEAAVSFCWAYPMGGIREPSAEVSREMGLVCLEITQSPELRFAFSGGFLLFDAAGAVVAVQSLTFDLGFGEDLVFEEPRPFRTEAVPPLVEAGRMRPVNLPELTRFGAKSFCWLMPGELLPVVGGGEPWCASASGGFVYVMDGSVASWSDTVEDTTLLFKLVPHVRAAPEAGATEAALLEDEAYVHSHVNAMEQALSDAVQAMVVAKPSDPLAFLGQHLLDASGKAR